MECLQWLNMNFGNRNEWIDDYSQAHQAKASDE